MTKKDDGTYTPIRVSTLRGDRKTPFDVYIQAGTKFILYCREGSSFEGERLARLLAKKLKKLFIRPDDTEVYQKYLNQSIDEAYDKSSGKPIEVRAEVIQGFQQAKTEEFMEEPGDEFNYKTVRASVQRFIEFLDKEPQGAGALLHLRNADHNVTHHSVNVAALSAAMALRLDMREGIQQNMLALGCLLHDIEHFYSEFDLTRPMTSLSGEQAALYKGHPLAGAQRFQGAKFIDQLVLKIIVQHEEHMDGTGFPRGIRGDDMDPLVLVAATANAYDRLVSFDGMEPKAALKHILIDKMGAFPLPYLQALQAILKEQKVV